MKKATVVSLLLSLCIVAAMLLTLGGCTPASPQTPDTGPASSDTTTTEKPAPTVLGIGNTVCTVEVIDAEQHTSVFEVHTDEQYLGEALLNLDLIEGTTGSAGFYVKAVNGIVADYDVDKTFWAFYVNFELSSHGVEKTPVTDGAVYQFKVEK